MTRLLKASLTAVAIAFGLAGAATSAKADFTATFDGVSPASGSAGQYNWHTSSVVAGVVYNGTNNPDITGSTHFVTFCIQINPAQYISSGLPYTYNVVGLESAPAGGGSTAMTTAQANQIRRMWSAEYSNLGSDVNKSAAFQWAVWEILEQVTYGSEVDSIGQLVNQFRSEALDTNNALANLAAMSNGTDQDQIFELGSGYGFNQGSIVAVPVPAGLVLAFSALVPCVAFRRRLMNKAA